ncbi:MAG: hypothetical protein P9L94_08930 [Candidatus Hinthialibacter antarcticus]|nr:hypothetical protein [Candidatus Hinthialibacter antarcticus]
MANKNKYDWLHRWAPTIVALIAIGGFALAAVLYFPNQQIALKDELIKILQESFDQQKQILELTTFPKALENIKAQKELYEMEIQKLKEERERLIELTNIQKVGFEKGLELLTNRITELQKKIDVVSTNRFKSVQEFKDYIDKVELLLPTPTAQPGE